MVVDKKEVEQELRRRIRWGYHPYYGKESAEDHDANWLVLSETEFDRIVKEETHSTADGPMICQC